MIGKIPGFWLVNWHMIWSCINLSESYINLPVFVCMYVCSFLLPMKRSRRQSWDKFVINCFGVWYNLYLAIRGLYLYDSPVKQGLQITNDFGLWDVLGNMVDGNLLSKSQWKKIVWERAWAKEKEVWNEEFF